MIIKFVADDELADAIEDYAEGNDLALEEAVVALVRFGLMKANQSQSVSGNISGNVVQGRDFHGGLTVN